MLRRHSRNRRHRPTVHASESHEERRRGFRTLKQPQDLTSPFSLTATLTDPPAATCTARKTCGSSPSTSIGVDSSSSLSNFWPGRAGSSTSTVRLPSCPSSFIPHDQTWRAEGEIAIAREGPPLTRPASSTARLCMPATQTVSKPAPGAPNNPSFTASLTHACRRGRLISLVSGPSPSCPAPSVSPKTKR